MFSHHELMFLQAAEARYGGHPKARPRPAWWWTRFGRVTGVRVRIPDEGGTVRYLMLIVVDESQDAPGPPLAETEAWVEEMDRRGVRVLGQPLRSAAEATTVQVRDGRVLVTDGPFAETKEQIGGFDIIDCANLDEAIEIASKHPMARFGKIDVRPFWEGFPD